MNKEAVAQHTMTAVLQLIGDIATAASAIDLNSPSGADLACKYAKTGKIWAEVFAVVFDLCGQSKPETIEELAARDPDVAAILTAAHAAAKEAATGVPPGFELVE